MSRLQRAMRTQNHCCLQGVTTRRGFMNYNGGTSFRISQKIKQIKKGKLFMFNRKRKTSVSITHLCQREVVKTLTTKLKLTRTTEHLLFLHHDFLKKEFQAFILKIHVFVSNHKFIQELLIYTGAHH